MLIIIITYTTYIAPYKSGHSSERSVKVLNERRKVIIVHRQISFE